MGGPILSFEKHVSQKAAAGTITVVPASLFRRLLAFILDIAVALSAGVILQGALVSWCPNICGGVTFVSLWCFTFSFYFLQDAAGGVGTVGKALFRLQIVSVIGGPVSRRVILVRGGLILLGFCGFGTPLLFGGYPEQRRPFFDVWTRTVVIQQKCKPGRVLPLKIN